jgi:uncharacterized protein (TIGR03086 family)
MNDDTAARATQAVDFFIDAVAQIPAQSWDQPANLDGWSIRELVAHTTGTAAKLVTLAQGGEAAQGPANPDDWKSSDPVGQLRELADRLNDALASAGPDALQAMRFPVFGLTIHVWDVYRSQHRRVDVPADLLAFCREVVESVPEDQLRRPGMFGPAQPVPEAATPTDRLIAFVGRPVDG